MCALALDLEKSKLAISIKIRHGRTERLNLLYCSLKYERSMQFASNHTARTKRPDLLLRDYVGLGLAATNPMVYVFHRRVNSVKRMGQMANLENGNR